MTLTKETQDVVNDVLASEYPLEALANFKYNNKLLKDWRFIFFDDNYGADIPYFLKSQEIDNFHIYSLASANKMLVIDNDTYNDIITTGTTTYGIDTCIALDTQTVSYLKEIFTENPKEINEKSKYFIEYLLKNDINYDCSLYILENANKLNSNKEIIDTYENLLACERFKVINSQRYFNNGIIEYMKTNDELKLLTDEIFHIMKNDSKLPEVAVLWNRYYAIKALILKVALIELTYNKKGVKFKTNLLLDFINNELGTIFERELAISYLFFSRDKRVDSFFKYIKPNCNDIVYRISSMAWDLSHLRHLEYLMATLRPLDARYCLYSIITFDYGLQEVLKAYPISRCAMSNGIFLPVFKTPLYELITEIRDLQNYIFDTKPTRMKTHNSVNYKELIRKLESELNNIIKL